MCTYNKKIIGKTVRDFKELRNGTFIKFTTDLIIGLTITDIARRGKYIIFHTDRNKVIVTHLRMTGKYIYVDESDFDRKHIRAYFKFSNDEYLLFKDVRTFGKIELFNNEKSTNIFDKLGPEPLSEQFNSEYLKNRLRYRKKPIKNALLDQNIVAGLGNIYVCEILYQSGINPTKASNELNENEYQSITKNTKKILAEAISKNGTTISDYRNIDNKTGEFQNFLQVYQKKTCLCGAQIKKIKQAGRTTYFCPECQK